MKKSLSFILALLVMLSFFSCNEIGLGDEVEVNRSMVGDPTCDPVTDGTWEGSDVEVSDINGWLYNTIRGNYRIEDLKMVYVEASDDSLVLDEYFTTRLIAGQHIDSGDVVVSLDENDQIIVTYNTVNDWKIAEIHLSIVEGSFTEEPGDDYPAPADIPQTRKGSPKIGKFEFKEEFDEPVTEAVVETGKIFDINTNFYIAAHAVVVKTDENGGIIDEETAWGEGMPFDKSWAMFFLVDFELITVSNPNNFAISRWETTQLSGDWWHVYGPDDLLHNQPYSTSSKRPVHNMTWAEAAKFCNDLTRLLIDQGANLETVYEEDEIGNITGNADFSKYGFHLPTLEQWDAALASGLADEYEEFGYIYKTNKSTGEEGKKIFSMYGNVSEWIHDWSDEAAGTKMIMGGNFDAEDIKEGGIEERFANVGFRVVIDIRPDWELNVNN